MAKKAYFKDKSDNQIFWVDPADTDRYLDATDEKGNYLYDTDVSDAEIDEYERLEAQENALQEKSTRLGAEKATATTVKGEAEKQPQRYVLHNGIPMSPEEAAKRDQYGGVGGALMAAAEGFVDGALANLPVAALETIDPYLPSFPWTKDSYAERARLRREENPTISKTAEYVGMFAPTAGTIITKAAPALAKTAPKIYKGAEALSRLDIGSRLLNRFGAKAIPAEVLQEAAKSTASIEARAALIEAQLGAEAAQAYTKEASESLIESLMAQRYAGLKLGEKAKEALKMGVAAGKAGAIEGAIRSGGQELREINEFSPNMAGTQIVSEVVKSGVEGGIVGGALGGTLTVGTPILGKAASKAVSGLNDALQGLVGKVEEKLGSVLTDLRSKDIEAARKAMREAVKDSKGSTATDLAQALDDQANVYLNTLGYVYNLTEAKVAEGKLTPAQGEQMRKFLSLQLSDVEDLVQSKYAFKTKKGTYLLDPEKIVADITFDANMKPVFPPVIDKFVKKAQATSQSTEQLVDMFAKGISGSPVADKELIDVMLLDSYAALARNPSASIEDIGRDILQAKLAEREVGAYLSPVTRGRAVELGFGTGVLPTVAGAATSIGGSVADLPQVGVAGAVTAGLFGVSSMALDPVAVLQGLNRIDRASTLGSRALSDWSDRFLFKGVGGAKGGKGVLFAVAPKVEPTISREQDYSGKLRSFEKVRENLARFDNPDELAKFLEKNYDNMRDTTPEMADEAAKKTAFAFQFLKARLPKQNGKAVPDRNWKPDAAQLDKFNRYVRYVQDPNNILLDVESKGFVPQEGIEVMTQVYPEWREELKVSVLDALARKEEAGESIDSRKRYIVDKIFGTPVDKADLAKTQSVWGAINTGNKSGQIGTPNTTATPSQEIVAPSP